MGEGGGAVEPCAAALRAPRGGGRAAQGYQGPASVAQRPRPVPRTIDHLDFTYQSAGRLAMLARYLSPDLVTEGRCLILRGETGHGKTHLAAAIAYRAFDAFHRGARHPRRQCKWPYFRCGRQAERLVP